MYRIYLDDKEKEAVLIALGKCAWETRETTAYKTYDAAYKSIQKQVKEQQRL